MVDEEAPSTTEYLVAAQFWHTVELVARRDVDQVPCNEAFSITTLGTEDGNHGIELHTVDM